MGLILSLPATPGGGCWLSSMGHPQSLSYKTPLQPWWVGRRRACKKVEARDSRTRPLRVVLGTRLFCGPGTKWPVSHPTKLLGRLYICIHNIWGFPDCSVGKESACNSGDVGSIPGLGRSPQGGHGKPFQYSCLENPNRQRSLAGYSPWLCKELDTT